MKKQRKVIRALMNNTDGAVDQRVNTNTETSTPGNYSTNQPVLINFQIPENRNPRVLQKFEIQDTMLDKHSGYLEGILDLLSERERNLLKVSKHSKDQVITAASACFNKVLTVIN